MINILLIHQVIENEQKRYCDDSASNSSALAMVPLANCYQILHELVDVLFDCINTSVVAEDGYCLFG